MYNLILVLTVIILSSCGISRTRVHDVNKGSQAVLTLGSTLIVREPNLKVKLDLSGQIFQTAQCIMSPRNFVVEIYQKGATKSLHTTTISEDFKFSFDVSLSFEGEIVVKLVNSQTSKVLQEKSATVASGNDRLIINFQACEL